MLCHLDSCNQNDHDHIHTVRQRNRQPLRTFVQSEGCTSLSPFSQDEGRNPLATGSLAGGVPV